MTYIYSSITELGIGWIHKRKLKATLDSSYKYFLSALE